MAAPRLFVYTLRAHLREGIVDSLYEDLEAFVDFKYRERLEGLPGHVALQTCHSAQNALSFFKATLVSNVAVDEELMDELRKAIGARANDEGICSVACSVESSPYLHVRTEQGRSCTVSVQKFPVPRLSSMQEDETWIRDAIQPHLPAKARIVSVALWTQRMTQIVDAGHVFV